MTKFISRKFFVLLLASLGLGTGYLTEQTWLVVACAYIGIEGGIDGMSRWKSKDPVSEV